MRRINLVKPALIFGVVAGALLIGAPMIVKAQPGLSFSASHDFLPYQDFKDPVVDKVAGTDTTFFTDPQSQLRKTRASLTYPIIFSEGRTVLINDLSYQLIEFNHRNLETPVERAHSASYTLMLQHRLSQKWSVWALATPSMATDLEAEISEDDFNFQAATIFIRHFSERLSVGIGAAYSTQFGSAELLPVLAIDWNNGQNLMVKAIAPVSFEFWYRPSTRVDVGLLVSGDGNNFHGDPALYDVASPELRYTMLTIGPAAKITLSKLVKLNVEAGIVGLHRFEFFDGGNEVSSYDLEPSQYVRVGLQFGK